MVAHGPHFSRKNLPELWNRMEQAGENRERHSAYSDLARELGSYKDSVQKLYPAKLMWSEQIPIAKEIPSYLRIMIMGDPVLR